MVEAADGWQPIETVPKDTEILVWTRPWGVIVASLSAEFGEWLSRMQVPVSIKEDEELPTHWRPLPEAPSGMGAEAEAAPAQESGTSPP